MKVWQAHQRAAERKGGMGTHLFTGSPSMSLTPPTQQNTTGGIQMDSPSPSTTNAATSSINDLCTQLESLTLDE